MRTWVNGDLLTDPEAPVVGARDHGLTVGDGVFEVLKIIDGTPFAVDLHLARLTRSARGLGLPDPDHDEVRRGNGLQIRLHGFKSRTHLASAPLHGRLAQW